MTFCNYLLSPTRVEVVTDSLHMDHERTPLGFGPKAVTIPHLELVIACIGHTGGLVALWDATRVGHNWNIEDIGREGLGFIKTAAKFESWKLCDALCKDQPAFGTRTYAFGWSEKRGRFIGWEFEGAKKVKPLTDCLKLSPAAPWERGATWMNIALMQQLLCPDGIGGHVLSTTMTRDQDRTVISTSVLGHLPGYEDQLATFRAQAIPAGKMYAKGGSAETASAKPPMS